MPACGIESLHEGFIDSFDRRYPSRILETLLCDRTTGRNIIWADNEYEALGEGFMGDDEITVGKITGMNSGVIKPRIQKEAERQSLRTKTRAEVFTPSWLCNQMNNDLDEAWFGRRDAFNVERREDGAWTTNSEPVAFPSRKGHGWHAYVESRRLEITCGEAPYVCSRYDTVSGESLPVCDRVGFLDRKLRVVTEKTKTKKEWVRRAFDALKATYGFEYQGDNLLIARINVFETFCDHFRARWGGGLSDDELVEAAWIVSWNFWQMNGFTDAAPTNDLDAVFASTSADCAKPAPVVEQLSMFDLEEAFPAQTEESRDQSPIGTVVPYCLVYDWENDEAFEFRLLKDGRKSMGKKFYAVIGNPPYQEATEGTSDKPIYNHFIDEAYKVSTRAELITPARFLFNAGKTPKEWNRKMLDDSHLKVLDYQQKSDSVFPGTDIKGGVAITYWQADKSFGPIGVFSPHDELRSVQAKVSPCLAEQGMLSDIMYLQNRFNLTELYEDYPDARESISSNGRERRIVSSAFNKLAVFTNDKHAEDSIRVIGLEGSNRRAYKWISKKYIEDNGNLHNYKVILPKANGAGAIGEVLSTPLIGEPLIGYTQSFIGIGSTNTKEEAEAILKYVKTKFARALLGILKITQDNPPEKWIYVPLQDFTSSSDIDWTLPVPEIDRQLYAKYGLDEEEIEFIESHVKEMA